MIEAAPVLAVRNLTTAFRVDGEWTTVVNGIAFEIGPRETVAIVGESGSGKSVTALSIMRLLPAANSRVDGRNPARGARPSAAARSGDAIGPRQPDLDDLPGADDEPEPGADPRVPDRRGARLPPLPRSHSGRSRDIADPGARSHPVRGVAAARVPASALRRHAPARDDRDGAGVQAEAPDRRRADHGARRHHPGGDPRAHQDAAGRGRHGRRVHHARHGRRGRDRRPHGRHAERQRGRAGADRPPLRRAARALHACAARRGAAPRLDEGPARSATVSGRSIPSPASAKSSPTRRRLPRSPRGRCSRSPISSPASTSTPACSGASGHACMRSRTSRSRSPPARRWRWWAKAVAASRPPAARSCASSSRAPAPCCSRARTCAPSTARGCAPRAAGCR